MSGGVRKRTPHPLLFGYVWCHQKIEGEVAHSGSHGPCPHNIRVCILKIDNDPEIFKMLEEDARSEKPVRECETTCRKAALNIVEKEQPIRGPELRDKLSDLGYTAYRISQVLSYMRKKGYLKANRKGNALVYELPM